MIVDSSNLGAVLQQLAHLGEPGVSYMSSCGTAGWHARVKLPAPPGCQAQVASGFDCRSPEEAVQQMIDRLEDLRGQSVAEQAGNPRLKLVKST